MWVVGPSHRWIWNQRSCIDLCRSRGISQSLQLLSWGAHLLSSAFLCGLVTLLNQTASIILFTYRNLSAVDAILTVHSVRAVETSGFGSRKELLRLVHIRLDCCRSAQTVDHSVKLRGHLLPLTLILLFILLHLLLQILDLRLNIAEGPLLRLLHLNHHFLNLFKLLEIVSL